MSPKTSDDVSNVTNFYLKIRFFLDILRLLLLPHMLLGFFCGGGSFGRILAHGKGGEFRKQHVNKILKNVTLLAPGFFVINALRTTSGGQLTRFFVYRFQLYYHR